MILKYSEIINKLSQIDLSKYSKNRNFIDGDVTMLSPYISRGMLSAKIVLNSILSRNINIAKIEKFIQLLLMIKRRQIIFLFHPTMKYYLQPLIIEY